MDRLSTGCKGIDDLMMGGVPRGVATGFFGVPNIGKTWCCKQIAVKCILPEKEGGFNKKVLYVDTESFFKDKETRDLYWSYFSKRWSIPSNLRDRMEIRIIPDIFKLGSLFGIEFTIIQEKERVSAIAKYPRKESSDKEPQKSSIQAENWIEYSPLYKEMKKEDYGLVVIDSITVPIKAVIPKSTQNLPGRGTLEDPLLSAFSLIAGEFDIPVLFTNHAVRDPMRQSYLKQWGGDDMLFFIKRWFGILEGLKEQKNQYGDRVRRIYRYRYPGLDPMVSLALLQKDMGYIDPEDLKRGKG